MSDFDSDDRGQVSPFLPPGWGAMLLLALLAFAVDLILGVSTYTHTGPFGRVWIWSPGLTILYAVVVVSVFQLVRGRSVGDFDE